MKRSVKVGISILSVIVAISAIVAYFLLVNKLILAKRELKESRAQIFKALKREQLLEEQLKEAQKQLQEVKLALKDTKRELSFVNAKLLGIEKDNTALVQEKQKLEAKLHSLKELKTAIRLVKLEIHQQKLQQYFARKKQQEEIDARKLASGNRGFLIKDGRLLCSSKIKIEVKPAY